MGFWKKKKKVLLTSHRQGPKHETLSVYLTFLTSLELPKQNIKKPLGIHQGFKHSRLLGGNYCWPFNIAFVLACWLCLTCLHRCLLTWWFSPLQRAAAVEMNDSLLCALIVAHFGTKTVDGTHVTNVSAVMTLCTDREMEWRCNKVRCK